MMWLKNAKKLTNNDQHTICNCQWICIEGSIFKINSFGTQFCQPDSDIIATIQKLLKEALVTLKAIHIHSHQDKKIETNSLQIKGQIYTSIKSLIQQETNYNIIKNQIQSAPQIYQHRWQLNPEKIASMFTWTLR